MLEYIFLTEMPEESREKWGSFLIGTLAEVNKQNTVDLVSVISTMYLCAFLDENESVVESTYRYTHV